MGQATPASLDAPPHTTGRSDFKKWICIWICHYSEKCKNDGWGRIILQLLLKIFQKQKFHFQEDQRKPPTKSPRASLAGSSPWPAPGASRRPAYLGATSWSTVRAMRTSSGRWAAAPWASTWSWGQPASLRLPGWGLPCTVMCVDNEGHIIYSDPGRSLEDKLRDSYQGQIRVRVRHM